MFCDRTLSAQGNPCRVVAGKPGTFVRAEETHPLTRCFIDFRSENETTVSCYSLNGREINCCGHGMLGAAYQLHNSTGETQGVIRYGDQQLPWYTCRELYWVSLPGISVTPSQPPQWLTDLFGETSPLAAATAGGDADYLVVQWPPGFDLATLAVPEGLGNFTRRALIATCESDYSHDLAQVESRYFAPQYGVPEDPGTGSAMRVLATYWQQLGLGRQLSNYQRSISGSLLFSEIAESNQVRVGGRVVPTDKEQSFDTVD